MAAKPSFFVIFVKITFNKFMKHTQILLLSLSLMLLTISCGAVKGVSTQSSFDLESTSWQAYEVGGKAVESSQGSYTITFNVDNRVSGKGTCNVIMGGYTQSSGGELTLTQLATTRAACPNMAAEAQFLIALESVCAYAVVDDKLTLYDSDGNEVLKFWNCANF